jgi:hypothetical protein
VSELKNYEVTISAQAVIVVIGAESEDDAHDIARDECGFRSGTVYDTKAREITDASDLEASKRHADGVAQP